MIKEMDVLFLQGPAGTGKTTLARVLAEQTGWVHLDRDQIEERVGEDRALIYQQLASELGQVLARGERAIVDAPFLYEDGDDFLAWQKDLPAFSYLIASLAVSPKERKKRRRKRGLPRDQIKDWDEVLGHEEEIYQPLPGSIILPSALTISAAAAMLVWLLEAGGRSIRRAATDDLLLVQQLKDSILSESFSQFLYEDELSLERQQVASPQAVQEMIEENEVFLAEKNDQVFAMLALSKIQEDDQGKKYRKIFSGYSRGQHAASALALKFIARSRQEELDYLLAHVYRDNEVSQRAMTSFGFAPNGQRHENVLVPRVPIEHWILPLKPGDEGC